jgi:hypothetical protein
MRRIQSEIANLPEVSYGVAVLQRIAAGGSVVDSRSASNSASGGSIFERPTRAWPSSSCSLPRIHGVRGRACRHFFGQVESGLGGRR